MLLPLGDDNSAVTTTPIVVWTLIALNCLVWYLQLTLGSDFTYGYSTVPYEITKGSDLQLAQTILVDGQQIEIPHAPGPGLLYLTILFSMFMHGSWGHIFGNMLYLFIFGDQIEDALGHLRFLAFYLLAGIAGSIAHIAADPDSIIPCLGASGAIAGVLGAYLIKFPRNTVRVLFVRSIAYMPAFIVLGGWVLLQIVGQVGSPAGQATGVAYMAHLGGFGAGLLLVLLLGRSGAQGVRAARAVR